jgi:hypothetical protein
MWHDRGLALVYAPVLGAWLFAALEATVRPLWAAIAGAGFALAFLVELERHNGTWGRLKKVRRAHRAGQWPPGKSDLSGNEIPPGKGTRVRITFDDPTKADLRFELANHELEEIIESTRAKRHISSRALGRSS